MDQVIFKIGPKKDITVCASFFPDECGIDGLFEDAVKVLCSDLALSREELFRKIPDLEKAKNTLRLVSLKELIRRTTETTGDAYEAVEIMSDILPELKKLRESAETYQRRKERDLSRAESLTLFSKVGNLGNNEGDSALKIFRRYNGDVEVRFKMFLLVLSNKDITEANKIIENTKEKQSEFYKVMTLIYECYVTKNAEKLADLETYYTAPYDSFTTIMMQRIKSNL